MSVLFSMIRDVGGNNSFILSPADYKFYTTLVAGVVQSFTAPSIYQKWVAIMMIEPGDAIWTALNATASLPGASVTAANSELNVPGWFVNGGDIITAITADSSDNFGIKFYTIQD